MGGLFKGCSSLRFLNLSSFQTPVIERLNYLFQDCKSLTSIYFPFLESSKYVGLDYAFKGCTSLSSLDLSNFTYFQRCSYNNYMFQDCSSLQFINFGNTLINSQKYIDIFKKSPENIIICSVDNNWNNILNGNNNGGIISISCINNGSLDNDINAKSCYTKNTTFNKQACAKCDTNYYQIYNSSSNNNSKISCQKIPQGYYLNINETYPIHKQCFSSCKTCEKGGDENYHNYIEAKKLTIYVKNILEIIKIATVI